MPKVPGLRDPADWRARQIKREPLPTPRLPVRRRAPARQTSAGARLAATAAPAGRRDRPAPTRRHLLRAAAGGGALGLVLAGAGKAAAQSAHHPIRLWFLADVDSLVTNNVVQRLIQEATDPFVAQHKGVVVQAGFMEGNGIIPSMIAGTGPDVISDWYAAPYWAGNLLLPLDEWMRRDNIDASVWSVGQMSVMKMPFGTYMLPAYFSPMVYVVRLSDFDEIGLEYPDPNWTYKDFAAICRKLTVHTANKTRYGAGYQWHAGQIGEETWNFRAFGGDIMDPTGTRQTLDTAACIRCGQWLFEELFWPQICTERDAFWGNSGVDGLVHDQEVMRAIWDGMIMNTAAAIRDSFKWAIYPSPIYPAGRFTQGTEDFYGINANTRNPEMAWELLKWLSYEKTFQRALMRIGAVPPARNDLWPEWQSVVEEVAPPTRGKGLEWFGDGAVKGYALPAEYFRYDTSQVQAIDNVWAGKLWNHQIDVATAWKQADRQANAFLAQAASANAQQARIDALIAHAAAAHGAVTFPAPARSGFGTAATPAPHLVTVRGATYILQGAGQGVQGGGDNATFFCAASVAARATFTCRVTSIANVNAPSIPNGAKIGLMVRGDLSSEAPSAEIELAMGRGIHFAARSLPAAAYGDLRAGDAPGLLGASGLLRDGGTKQANYLVKPVWLRLVRDAGRWDAFTSLDGVHWKPAGKAGVETAGVWVGLFVTAHDGALGKSGLMIKATFDHVEGFTPTHPYQLGSP